MAMKRAAVRESGDTQPQLQLQPQQQHKQQLQPQVQPQQQQVPIRATLFERQCVLIRGVPNEALLPQYVAGMKDFHLDEVLEERMTEGNCANPSCSAELHSQGAGAHRGDIRALMLGPAEATNIRRSWFCSAVCYQKTMKLRGELQANKSFSRSSGADKPRIEIAGADGTGDIDQLLSVLDGELAIEPAPATSDARSVTFNTDPGKHRVASLLRIIQLTNMHCSSSASHAAEENVKIPSRGSGQKSCPTKRGRSRSHNEG
jgi:hypothetical protein